LKTTLLEFIEISDILKSLNIKRASGHDLISHHMLKNTANAVSIPLKIIRGGIVQLRPTLPISFLTRDQNNLGSDEFSSRKLFELRKNCCFAWITTRWNVWHANSNICSHIYAGQHLNNNALINESRAWR
jgi:hypothetical protein